ncbi:hypothetical protein [Streptomyces sp. NPDC057199]|uniref:hypothetical protein n=1 Tax=Streptomyces sp. NPDC057199 TaxID=3346047 RepID=UPI00363FE59E
MASAPRAAADVRNSKVSLVPGTLGWSSTMSSPTITLTYERLLDPHPAKGSTA